MPFDDTGFHKSTKLTTYLHGMGITPVPMTVLTVHKTEQVKLNPPDALVTLKPYLLALTLITAGTALLMGYNDYALWKIILSALVAGLLGTLITVIAVMAISDIFDIEVRGPAKWVERRALAYNDYIYPTPIREIVRRIRRSDRNATLYYGELMREEMVLDPYLVIEHNGERACLGIWVDQTIIARAKLD